jgi:hypothetical protein
LVSEVALTLLAHHHAKDGAKLSAKEALAKARRNLDAAVMERLETIEPAEARKLLPKRLVEALRKADVETAMAQDPWRSRQQRNDKEPTQAPKKKFITTDDFFSRLEKTFG